MYVAVADAAREPPTDIIAIRPLYDNSWQSPPVISIAKLLIYTTAPPIKQFFALSL